MKMKTVAALALAAMLVSPVMAEDEAKGKKKKAKGNRGNSTAMQLIKALAPVGLTDEQTTKIKELGKASSEAIAKIRKDSGLTPEVMKKRTEAQKALKESGKKGKELAAAIAEKAGLSEAQIASFKKMNEARMGFQKSVIGMLTDDQKAKLPEKLQRFAKAGQAKKGGKKKKKAE